MKKSKLIRLICLCLSVVMIFCLTGCSGSDNDYDVDSNYENIDNEYNDQNNEYDDQNDEYNDQNGEYDNNSDTPGYYESDSSDFSFNNKGMPSFGHQSIVPTGYIGIYTVDDLLNADINPNENYILMNDLDLSSVANWDGINNEATFDGNGYTISNLKSDCSGLFDSANNISTLNLINIEISAKINHSGSIGGICNTLRGNMMGCYVSGVIDCDYYGEDRSESCANIGGNVGRQFDGGNISFCKNNAAIFVEAPIGYNVAVGGIAGTVVGINDCINYGEIILETESSDGLDDPFTLIIEETDTNPYIQDNAGVGGICGQTSYYGNIKIDACRNEGNVYSNNAAGGILGCAYFKSSDSISITNCSNTGRVLGYADSDSEWVCAVGGILGTSSSNGSSIIENCFNSGEVGSHKEYYPDYDVTYIGAIIGYEGFLGESEANFVIRNCVYNQTCEEVAGIGAMYSSVIALSDEELKDINNYNFTNVKSWQNSTSDEVPYPFYIGNYY